MIYKEAIALNQLDSDSKYEDVSKAFGPFGSFSKVSYMVPKGTYLYRSRLQDEPFEIVDRKDLSFHPNPEAVAIQRANRAGVQTFYGCTNFDFSNFDQKNAIQTAILEGSNMRRSRTPYDFEEYGYVSRWRTTKELKVISFLYYDFSKKMHPSLQAAKKICESYIIKTSANKARDLEINQWLANIYAKEFDEADPNKYIISSELSFRFLKNEHSGILYPSVQTEGMAVNIALHKEAEESLELEYVVEVRNYQRNSNTGIDSIRHIKTMKKEKIAGWIKVL